MKNLNKFFPLSYKCTDGQTLAGNLVLYVLGYYAGQIVTAVLSLLYAMVSGFMPGAVTRILNALIVLVSTAGTFVSVYAVIGVVLAILVYRKVIEETV
jgi:uncharacterized YccA/Bax inhibitor family protein